MMTDGDHKTIQLCNYKDSDNDNDNDNHYYY